MGESFSVGEIAILQNCDDPRDNGDECEIVRLPEPKSYRFNGRVVPAGHYIVKHRVGWQGTPYWGAPPETLRKRPPPREQTSTWEDVIVWRPKAKESERV